MARASGSVLSDVWREIRKGGAFRADAAKWSGPTRVGGGSDLDAYTDGAQDRFIPFARDFAPVRSLISPIVLLARAPQAAMAKQVAERHQSHGGSPAKQRSGERESVVTGR